MSKVQTLSLTLIALIAFAANSLLCRIALKSTHIDPATFTAVRIVSGAAVLFLYLRVRPNGSASSGSWTSALALFIYAAAFSLAYVALPAGTGALLLFGSVQASMIAYGLLRGERLAGLRLLGFSVALAGLIVLLLPGVSAPPVGRSLLMVCAGIGWGVYSLRGRGAPDPGAATAGNFLRAAVFAAAFGATALPLQAIDWTGVAYAVLSGAVASGMGYIVWYTALGGLTAIEAATVQSSVPVLAAAGGSMLLAEPITLRLALCTIAILGGVSLVVLRRR